MAIVGLIAMMFSASVLAQTEPTWVKEGVDWTQYTKFLIKPLNVDDVQLIRPPWAADDPKPWTLTIDNMGAVQAIFRDVLNAELEGKSICELISNLDAVPEGTVVFPYEPLLRVRGPLATIRHLDATEANLARYETWRVFEPMVMANFGVTRTFPAPDSARAEVVQIFGDYRVGDAMVMAEEFPVVAGIVPEAESAGPVGTVLAFTDDQTLMATDETLFLDIGAADGVGVGDVFAIFSANEKTAETALLEDRLTTVRVVHTSEATSTARVTEVRDAGMRPGTPVRRTQRMPQ